MTRISVLMAAVVFMSACTSLVEKGDKLYEQGMYQQAADFYQQALNEDANDVEAQQRLTQARHKIIDRGLIEVRMLRLASNHVAAADKLETILRNQSEWHLETMGAQAATQHEEVGYAGQFLRQHAQDLAASQFPDKFRWFEHKYAFLISNTQLSPQLHGYQQTLAQLAQHKCDELANQVYGQRFYLKQLTQKYCSVWQTKKQLKVDSVDESRFRSVVFNKQLQLNTPNRRAHQQLVEGTVSELKDRFQRSLWYSPKGANTLTLNMLADVDYKRDSIHKQQEKRYLVNEYRPDPNNSSEQVEVEVERVYIYPVVDYRENYSVRLSYQGQLAGMLLSNQYMDSQSNQTTSHSANFDEAELKPQIAQFLDQSKTMSSYLSQLTFNFDEQLEQLWLNQYCHNQYAEADAENVLRCAKVAPSDSYVNSWFERQFGIDYKAMRTLYGV